MLSGALGLGLADQFLFHAFRRIGSASTLMIFSFQPLLMAIGALFILGHEMNRYHFASISFFIVCMLILSKGPSLTSGVTHLNPPKIRQKWKVSISTEVIGFVFAFLGVLVDSFGVLLTRHSFDSWPDTHPVYANAVRAVGGILFFLIFQTKSFWTTWRVHFVDLSRPQRKLVLLTSITGTFCSLSLWLTAIKYGDVATLTGVSGLNPIINSIYQLVVLKIKPRPGFFLALGFFSIGFIFAWYATLH